MANVEQSYAVIPIPRTLEETKASFTELNRVLLQIQEDMAKMQGLQGRTPEFASDVDVGGNVITNLGEGSSDQDSVRKDQILVRGTISSSRMAHVDADGNLSSVEDLSDYIKSGDYQLESATKDGKLYLYLTPFERVTPAISSSVNILSDRVRTLEANIARRSQMAAVAGYLQDQIDSISASAPDINGNGTPTWLRASNVVIEDGTNANTIKVTATNRWNAGAAGPTDNIGKTGTPVGSFTLDATGSQLTVDLDAIDPDQEDYVVASLGYCILTNNSNTGFVVSPLPSGNDLLLTFTADPAGGAVDLTAMVDTGSFSVAVILMTINP